MKLKDFAELGLPIRNSLIIDVHCHLGAPSNSYIPYVSETEQLRAYKETMDSVGVNYSVISMLRGLFTDDLEANLELAEMMKDNADLFGWVTYIPALPNLSIQMAERCFSLSNRFVGIKAHPEINAHPLGGKGYEPMWEYADSKGLILLLHTWNTPNSDPSQLSDILKRYKNIKVLIGHCGGEEPAITTAIHLANKFDNVFLDLTGSFYYSGKRLEEYILRTDASKLLFSSDMTFNNVCWEIGHILYANIADSIKEQILGLNAKHLLGNWRFSSEN